uniref:Uncharacterized protein n=1 Tax=Vannella robusta TaxID=1487602 RepID=A0A7S4MEQ4_9EUKA|mmetsp:Transcript_20134/g.25506  ORF Transcript_20134/g.25506 Transcript_20134/m.25506 type:complete len:491 (+) Transcript_20134:616-2088(+)
MSKEESASADVPKELTDAYENLNKVLNDVSDCVFGGTEVLSYGHPKIIMHLQKVEEAMNTLRKTRETLVKREAQDKSLADDITTTEELLKFDLRGTEVSMTPKANNWLARMLNAELTWFDDLTMLRGQHYPSYLMCDMADSFTKCAQTFFKHKKILRGIGILQAQAIALVVEYGWSQTDDCGDQPCKVMGNITAAWRRMARDIGILNTDDKLRGAIPSVHRQLGDSLAVIQQLDEYIDWDDNNRCKAIITAINKAIDTLPASAPPHKVSEPTEAGSTSDEDTRVIFAPGVVLHAADLLKAMKAAEEGHPNPTEFLKLPPGAPVPEIVLGKRTRERPPVEEPPAKKTAPKPAAPSKDEEKKKRELAKLRTRLGKKMATQCKRVKFTSLNNKPIAELSEPGTYETALAFTEGIGSVESDSSRMLRKTLDFDDIFELFPELPAEHECTYTGKGWFVVRPRGGCKVKGVPESMEFRFDKSKNLLIFKIKMVLNQ